MACSSASSSHDVPVLLISWSDAAWLASSGCGPCRAVLPVVRGPLFWCIAWSAATSAVSWLMVCSQEINAKRPPDSNGTGTYAKRGHRVRVAAGVVRPQTHGQREGKLPSAVPLATGDLQDGSPPSGDLCAPGGSSGWARRDRVCPQPAARPPATRLAARLLARRTLGKQPFASLTPACLLRRSAAW